MKNLEKRLKGVYVSPEMMINLLFEWHKNKVFCLPYLKLPEDVEICSVDYIPERRCFIFLLESKEFPLIDLGCTPEIILPECIEIEFSKHMTTKIKKQIRDVPRKLEKKFLDEAIKQYGWQGAPIGTISGV